VRGDTIGHLPAYEESLPGELFGTVERLVRMALTGEVLGELEDRRVPGVALRRSNDRMTRRWSGFEAELATPQGAGVRRQASSQRWDCARLRLEMLRRWGSATASRTTLDHIDGRAPGSAPSTLIDYFPDDSSSSSTSRT